MWYLLMFFLFFWTFLVNKTFFLFFLLVFAPSTHKNGNFSGSIGLKRNFLCDGVGEEKKKTIAYIRYKKHEYREMYDHIKLLIVIEYLFTLLCCCWVDVKIHKKKSEDITKLKLKLKFLKFLLYCTNILTISSSFPTKYPPLHQKHSHKVYLISLLYYFSS